MAVAGDIPVVWYFAASLSWPARSSALRVKNRAARMTANEKPRTITESATAASKFLCRVP